MGGRLQRGMHASSPPRVHDGDRTARDRAILVVPPVEMLRPGHGYVIGHVDTRRIVEFLRGAGLRPRAGTVERARGWAIMRTSRRARRPDERSADLDDAGLLAIVAMGRDYLGGAGLLPHPE